MVKDAWHYRRIGIIERHKVRIAQSLETMGDFCIEEAQWHVRSFRWWRYLSL